MKEREILNYFGFFHLSNVSFLDPIFKQFDMNVNYLFSVLLFFGKKQTNKSYNLLKKNCKDIKNGNRWRTYRDLNEGAVAESRHGEFGQDGPIAVVAGSQRAEMLAIPVGQHPTVERVVQIHHRNGFQ